MINSRFFQYTQRFAVGIYNWDGINIVFFEKLVGIGQGSGRLTGNKRLARFSGKARNQGNIVPMNAI